MKLPGTYKTDIILVCGDFGVGFWNWSEETFYDFLSEQEYTVLFIDGNRENFADFRARYGDGPYMQDMYSAGFYPYPSEEAYWGYWSKQCMKAGIEADHTPLRRTESG